MNRNTRKAPVRGFEPDRAASETRPSLRVDGLDEYVARQRLIDALVAQQGEAKHRIKVPLLGHFRAMASRTDQMTKTGSMDGGASSASFQLKRKPLNKSFGAAEVARLKALGVPVVVTPGTLTIRAEYLKDAKLLGSIQKLIKKHDEFGIVPDDFFSEGEPAYETDDTTLLRLLRADPEKGATDDLIEMVMDITIMKPEAKGRLDVDTVISSAKASLAGVSPVADVEKPSTKVTKLTGETRRRKAA